MVLDPGQERSVPNGECVDNKELRGNMNMKQSVTVSKWGGIRKLGLAGLWAVCRASDGRQERRQAGRQAGGQAEIWDESAATLKSGASGPPKCTTTTLHDTSHLTQPPGAEESRPHPYPPHLPHPPDAVAVHAGIPVP